jgi:hypothetical protein
MQTTETITELETIFEHSSPTLSERRRGPRHHFTATVELIDLEYRNRIQARTSDLSSGGCYVDTTNPLPPTTAVKMRLTRDNCSFEVQARVVYSLPGMGMGLAFTSAAPEQLKVLKKWMRQLAGESQPDACTLNAKAQTGLASATAADAALVLDSLVKELVRYGVFPREIGESMLLNLRAKS